MGSERPFCNHCQNGTKHEVVHEVTRKRHDGGSEFPRVIDETWRLIRCLGCESIKVLVIESCLDFSGPRHTEYPPKPVRRQPDWSSSLPSPLTSIIQETYVAINSGCLALAAIGARTLVKMMLTDMLGDIGGFEAKLQRAIERNFLTETQRRTVSAAVEAGHAAAHRGFTPDSGQIRDVLDIIEHALKQRYIVESASQRLVESVPKRIKVSE